MLTQRVRETTNTLFLREPIDKDNPVGYIGCTVTRNPERTVTMNRHRQTYFELNPAPSEPGPVRIVLGAILGAVFAMLALYCSIVFLFSL